MVAEWIEERFERERPRLLAVAFRLLGSRDDAEDAVQEAWLRLNRADSRGVDRPSFLGWHQRRVVDGRRLLSWRCQEAEAPGPNADPYLTPCSSLMRARPQWVRAKP
jgi:DNA-directed RNA polymerase specialized sigma24 family protein